MPKHFFTDYKEAFPSVLLFEFCYKLITLLLLRPALGLVMRLGKGSAVFNFDILDFATGPRGFFTLCLLLLLAVFCTYFEFAVLFLLFYYASCKKPVGLRYAISLAFTSFQSLKSLGFPLFGCYVLVLLPIADCGLSSSLIPLFKVPDFISQALSQTSSGHLLLLLFQLVVFLLFFLLLFTLPAMCLGRIPFGRAAGQSVLRMRHLSASSLCFLMGCILMWRILFVTPGLLPQYYPGISNATFTEILKTVIFSLRIFPFLSYLMSLTLRISVTFLLLAASADLYLHHGGPVRIDEEAVSRVEKRIQKTTGIALGLTAGAATGIKILLAPLQRRIETIPFYQKHQRGLRTGALLAALFLFLSLLEGTYFLHDPITIGHRGSSSGVENTIEAVQGAISAGAQYAEVDVMLSADGIPIVCHDANLKRLSGQNIYVYEKTAKELSELTLSQNGFTGSISTLDELLKFCKEKIGLLIELKPHGQESLSLTDQVLKVVKENDSMNNCLFHSVDYSLVRELKEKEPDCMAGYCIFANTGSLTVSSLIDLGVDFLTVEESALSRRFILKCQRAWLPVYVWTVNQSSSMKQYLDMGVCGFITDVPDLSVQVIKKRLGRDPENPYPTIQFPQ